MLVEEINVKGVELLKEEKWYCETLKNELNFLTKVSMNFFEALNMVIMIHILFNPLNNPQNKFYFSN